MKNENRKLKINVSEVSLIFRHWKHVGISDSLSFKLAQLYFGAGLKDLMDEDGKYPSIQFNQLSNALKYHQVRDLLESVVKSGSFIHGVGQNSYGVVWFASPLYMNEDILRSEMIAFRRAKRKAANDMDDGAIGGLFAPSSSSLEDPQNACNPGVYNSILTYTGIDNIILSERRDKPLANVKLAQKKTQIGQGLTEHEQQCLEFQMKRTAEDFFRWLWTSNEHNSLLFNMERFMQSDQGLKRCGLEKPLSSADSHGVMTTMVDRHLAPYMATSEGFYRANLFGRLAYLRNILNSGLGTRFLRESVQQYQHAKTHMLQQERERNVREQMQNRPISPFEWVNPQTGIRFYKDAIEGIRPIPAFAEPRPGLEYHWNGLTNMWKK